MALVLGCFLAGLWVYRNWQRFAVQNGKAPRLNVLESKSLGPRHGLYVVGYDRHRFLLASAPGGISMLSPLPEATAEEQQCQPAPHPLFSAALRAALNKRPHPGVPVLQGPRTEPGPVPA
jgi:flagellar biogenesis protein FliO